MEELTKRFNRVFANLPLGERTNTIYVDPHYGAMSWLILKIEVESQTAIAKKALQFMSYNRFI